MFFDKLKLLFTHDKELEILVKNMKKRRIREERESKAKNLSLCYDHKQEQNHSIYSEANCDYCKAQKIIKMLSRSREL